MPYGYNGRVLRVDLSTGQIDVEQPDQSFYRRYFGGGAMATYYLLNELPPATDPFAPDNVLVFATSVIVGCPVAGACRYTVAAKSPLTGGLGESQAGGFWGPELKFAGFDAVVVKGRSPEPVYLWVHDGEAELRPADRYWGRLSKEVEDGLREELGDPRIRVAQAGVAGEKLVRYAAVVNNLKHFNGRTGMGAVMGSKQLKAIAVRGTGKPEMGDPERVKAIAQKAAHWKHAFTDIGTPINVLPLNKGGILPTRNFHSGEFEGAEAISGERMRDSMLIDREGCYACAVQCKRVVQVEGRYRVDPAFGGPEYETVAVFGSLLCISDLEAVAKANELCNRYVLDTISTGAAIGFAMECFENGLLTKEDTDGVDLRFGNAEAMLTMVERIGRREGLGDLLAEGVMRAAQHIGKGAEAFALHVKGQELPMHDPRGKTGVAMGYALSPTGAEHLEMPHDVIFRLEGLPLQRVRPIGILEGIEPRELGPRKARLFYYTQQLFKMVGSLGMCNSTVLSHNHDLQDLADLAGAVTGWNVGLFELMKLGERFNNMARVFNLREGLTAEDDRLPDRLHAPLEGGALQGKAIDRKEFGETVRLYYQMAGWDDSTGVPTEAKLEELELGWAGLFLR